MSWLSSIEIKFCCGVFLLFISVYFYGFLSRMYSNPIALILLILLILLIDIFGVFFMRRGRKAEKVEPAKLKEKMQLERIENGRKQKMDYEYKKRALDEKDPERLYHKYIVKHNYPFKRFEDPLGEDYAMKWLKESPCYDELEDLLGNKGFSFDDEELTWLIKESLGLEKYEEFKKKINREAPDKLKDFISCFIRHFDAKDPENIDLLFKLIRENGYKISKNALESRIKKENLQYLEKSLLEEDSKKYQITLKEIDGMKGTEFEYFLKNLYEKMGYDANITSATNDQGADLLLKGKGERVVVQAKRHSGSVSNKAVQEAVAAISHYGANRAVVVTNSKFTDSAKNLAKSNNVELIERETLKHLIKTYWYN